MDIFPQLIGEKEFRYFTSDDYGALHGVLDEVTAKYLLDYLNNPAGEATVKADIERYLRPSIDSLTFHIKLKEEGYVELVNSLNPESLALSDVDLDDLIKKLSFLEANVSKIKSTIPARTSQAYKNFFAAMTGVSNRMVMSGISLTYADMLDRISANKFLFYTTGEKDHATGVGILNSKRRQWMIALKGANWLKYCKARGITVAERSKF